MNKIIQHESMRFSNLFSKITLTLFISLTCAFFANAQVSNYVFSESTGAVYTPITGGTVVVNNTVTSISNLPSFATYTLPFIFYYNNIGYSSVNIADNGYIILGNVGTASVTSIFPISATTNNDSAIACYGANLVSGTAPGTAEIRYEVTGTAPNRVFVVQYKDMQRRPGVVILAGLMNMQIRLSETTGLIEVIYRDAVALGGYAGTGQKGEVGLRGISNSDFNARYNTGTNFTPTVAVTLNNNTQVMTTGTTNTISAGTKFTWNPCVNVSNITATLASDNTTLNMAWTAPSIAPTGGYDWEVRTSGNPGSGATGLFAFGNSTTNSVSCTGMVGGMTYYAYVKVNCRNQWLPNNTAPSSLAVTPICAVASIPYTQNFEGVVAIPNTSNSPAPNNTVVGGHPECNSLATISGASMGVTNNTSLGYYGFTTKNIITTGAAAQNAWYFTQAINFPVSGTYRLGYKYGGSREQTFFQQKMKVYYGSVASATGMTVLLADHPNILTSPETNTINFTVTTPGNYYIGFNAYSNASQGYLQLDDITVDVSTCFPPTGLTSGQLTSNSAVIVWTPALASPSGYDYYVATSNTPPVATTPPSGATTSGNNLAQLSNLAPSTTYYFWVRSLCSSTDQSNWTTTPGVFTTSTAIVYCTPNGANIFQDFNGITNVLMGSINNTTGLETNNYGDYAALSTNVAQGATVPVAITYGTFFTYDTDIWIDWNNNGDFNDSGELAYTGESAFANPATLLASFVVPITAPLGQHRLRIGGIDDPMFAGGILTPCRIGQYQVFEDYSIYVTAPTPALTISDGTVGSSSTTICAGSTTCGTPIVLTSNPAAYQVYSWTPNNGTITGNIATGSVCFTPTATTTYILTAYQTTGNFASTSVSYTVYVNPLPAPIIISPAAPTRCQNDLPSALVASGGLSSNIIWSPVTGLYQDPVSTISYFGESSTTVYASPITTTTYTVTSVSPEGCTTSNTVTVTVIPVSGGTTSGNQVLNCTSQNASDITLTGYSGTIVKWQYSSSPSFASNVFDITSASNATNILSAAAIGQLSATRYFRAVVSNGSCIAYSTLSAVIISTLPTTSETTVVECDSYTWAENGQTYTSSGDYTHTTTTTGGCTNTATLHLTLFSSAITNQPVNTAICSTVGSVASVSVTTVSPAVSYQWQYRVVTTANPNPAWITIDSSLSAVYANFNAETLNITRTSTLPAVGTEYRVLIDVYCGAIASDSAKIIVVALVKAGTISASTAVCSDEDITFTLTNYSGTSIQWQSAPNATGTFVNIPGAIAPTYTLVNASAASDKSYRAIVTSSCNNTTATTAIKTITVNPISESGTATGGGLVCLGGSGTLKVVGNVGTIQWQYSLDGTNYLNAPNGATIPAGFTTFSTTSTTSVSATYLVTAITTPVFFRAKVSSGACSAVYTNVLQYTLGTAATAGTIISAATAPICKGTGTSLTLSGAVGIITWEKSTNWLTAVPTWVATTNHTTALATGNLTLSTAYRAKVTIGSCSVVYADYVAVMLIAAPLAKAISANTTSPAGTSTTTALCTSNVVPKVLTEGAGYNGTIQWQWSTTSTLTGFTDVVGETGVSYIITNPSVGANYYKVKVTNSCGVSVFSAVKTVYYKSCTPRMIAPEFKVVAFPNPYNENFSLDISTPSQERIEIAVYDLIGKLIERHELNPIEVAALQLGNKYSAGVYNVIVNQGINLETLHVIKR